MPRVVVFNRFGGPDVLQIVTDPASEPAAGEVSVRIEAFAVNPLDAMMRSGTSPAPVTLPHARLGIEASGVVDGLGADVVGFQIGDPVIVAAIPDAGIRGSYAEQITIPASRLIPRPAGLGATEAAAVWVAYSTAYGALIEKAQLRPGEYVLISAASGSVGRAAMQIANHVGALPLAITRHAANTESLLAAGAAAVIAIDQAQIPDTVRQHTGGAGADVVLDLVMGPGQQELINAARPGARLVAAGFLDSRPTPFPSGPPITTFNYRSFEHTLDPVVVRRMAAFLAAGLRVGAFRPAIDTVLSFDDIVEAHRRLDQGLNAGRKIVVTTETAGRA